MSFTGFDLSTIQDAKLGSTQVSYIYYGSNLIWPTSPTPPAHDYSLDYLTFEAMTNNVSFKLIENGSSYGYTANLEYSLNNGSTWNTLPINTYTTAINNGQKIIWRYTHPSAYAGFGLGTIVSTGQYKVYGNILSLVNGDTFLSQQTVHANIFTSLFDNDTNVVDATNLVLKSSATGVYDHMFRGCTNLIYSPTQIGRGYPYSADTRCCNAMFDGCTSLTTAPALPATSLGLSAYNSMFRNCTSLTTAPALPATSLEEYCYNEMFYGCTSLTTAPDLPATTLWIYCYADMFNGCTQLSYVKCLATDLSATGCLDNWLNNVSSTGTFYKDANTTWPSGTSGIPSTWTLLTYTP